MVVSPSVAADVLKVEFRKATIVAFRETTFQLSTTNGTLPSTFLVGELFSAIDYAPSIEVDNKLGASCSMVCELFGILAGFEFPVSEKADRIFSFLYFQFIEELIGVYQEFYPNVDTPYWNSSADFIRFGNNSVEIRFGKNREMVLSEFQSAGWPRSVESPLESEDNFKSTRQTIGTLNGKLEPLGIKFAFRQRHIYWSDIRQRDRQ